MARSGDKARLMLLDDEPMVLNSIACFFDLETDYEIVQFRCPLAALDYLKQHTVDAVVADLTGGPMKGEAFAAAARELDGDLPVIFLSGSVDDAHLDALRSVRASFCLQKPWSNCELWSTVMSAFACRRRKGD